MTRKTLLALLAGLVALFAAAGPSAAATAHADSVTWGEVAEEMNEILEDSWAKYQAGQISEAKAQVDVAYYSYYEKLGFEASVNSRVSGESAATAEYEFVLIKQAMSAEGEAEEVRSHLDILEGLLVEQATSLGGTKESATATFFEALIVILREGFEAILVLGAIIAYLVKSGNSASLKVVYGGALLALAASAALAVAINAITALSGASQEITEGVTVLIAAAMLIWVSNWILAKSDAGAWSRYIKGKTEASLSRGSVFSLALVAFLAVFREGAETILLYQAIRARAEETENMIWVGLGVGAVALVGVYLAIRFFSIRIPLRPFFLATSAVLALLAFSFAGSGIKELQEGGVVRVTPVDWVKTVDLLGIYPSAQTLSAQAIVLAAMVGLAVFTIRRARRRAADADRLATSASPTTATTQDTAADADRLATSASPAAATTQDATTDAAAPPATGGS
ncbi:MAG: FTR1 family iron permease [Bifidobacteriaceae bacterium]|nr:FTR1 family iron permease [Bifidobacteriaceae bacterium]